jgi:hypothetical protein
MADTRTSVRTRNPGVPTRHATTTNNTVAGGRWHAEVQHLEQAITEMIRVRPVTNQCRISFFELDGERDLHVNVTQEYRTGAVMGWSGPAAVEAGFVHNRRFRDERGVLGRIRDVVFAARSTA